MLLATAKTLRVGTILHHRDNRNADGTPQRWKLIGKPKTWKTRPDEVVLSLKHGLYRFDKANQSDLHLLHESAEAAIEAHSLKEAA